MSQSNNSMAVQYLLHRSGELLESAMGLYPYPDTRMIAYEFPDGSVYVDDEGEAKTYSSREEFNEVFKLVYPDKRDTNMLANIEEATAEIDDYEGAVTTGLIEED